MNSHASGTAEREQQRQELLDDLNSDCGPNWRDQYKPGSFGCHELLDRTLMSAEIVDQYVLSHPACVQNPEWYALAEQTATALHELYQRVGAEHLDDESGK